MFFVSCFVHNRQMPPGLLKHMKQIIETYGHQFPDFDIIWNLNDAPRTLRQKKQHGFFFGASNSQSRFNQMAFFMIKILFSDSKILF